MANTCCPPGYTYNVVNKICNPDAGGDLPQLPAIPCGCCPEGYAYVNTDGTFFSYQTGTYIHVQNPDATPFINNCVRIDNTSWAILPTDPVIDPIGCPCCPDGYIYDSVRAVCVQLKNPKSILSTIPCLDCNCVTPEPAPCPTCGPDGVAISFTYDFMTRQCDDCCTTGPVPIPCCIQPFIPPQFGDPDMTFRLTNLNYI